jgi:predicted nucleic acid-binding protein
VITVSNTTAITTLLKVGCSDLLTDLFGEVWVPSTVEQELLAFHASLPHGCVVHAVGWFSPRTGAAWFRRLPHFSI